MKNVLLIGSELGKGGAERSISLLSYYLEQHYHVTLCILSGKDRQKYYKTCKEVVFIDPPEHAGPIGKIKAWKFRLEKVKKLKEDKAIDVSISFLEGPDYVNVLTRGREKVVLSIRGSKMHDRVISGAMGQLRKKILIPWLYKKADKIVCVTNALKSELQEHFKISTSRLRTIYNFYEVNQIRQAAAEPLTEEEARIFSKPVVITSGRLHRAKEHDKLMRVISRVAKSIGLRLIILGDGEMKQELMSLAVTLNMKVHDWSNGSYQDADVYLMGFQSNAFKFYHHSKLFALASSWEGFPNVLAEALVCNLPALATDCYTGPREIFNIQCQDTQPVEQPVRTTTGSLLPLLQLPTDEIIDMWAKEIEYWLTAPNPDNGEFTKLTNRFTLDAMLQQWKEVIEN